MGTLLLIVLILLLVGALPSWPYSSGWGYYPSGGLGIVLVIIIVLLLMEEFSPQRSSVIWNDIEGMALYSNLLLLHAGHRSAHSLRSGYESRYRRRLTIKKRKISRREYESRKAQIERGSMY